MVLFIFPPPRHFRDVFKYIYIYASVFCKRKVRILYLIKNLILKITLHWKNILKIRKIVLFTSEYWCFFYKGKNFYPKKPTCFVGKWISINDAFFYFKIKTQLKNIRCMLTNADFGCIKERFLENREY